MRQSTLTGYNTYNVHVQYLNVTYNITIHHQHIKYHICTCTVPKCTIQVQIRNAIIYSYSRIIVFHIIHYVNFYMFTYKIINTLKVLNVMSISFVVLHV